MTPTTPEEFNDLTRIAADHARNDRPRSALAIYEDITNFPGAPPTTHYDHAVVLRTLGRHQEALKPLARFLATNPNDFKGWTNAGDSIRELGKTDAALQVFRHALALAPNTLEATKNMAAAHHNISRELIGANEMADALDHAERAAALDPDEPEFGVGLGELQLMLGDFAQGWAKWENRHAILLDDKRRRA